LPDLAEVEELGALDLKGKSERVEASRCGV
jgi:hypothetical protein